MGLRQILDWSISACRRGKTILNRSCKVGFGTDVGQPTWSVDRGKMMFHHSCGVNLRSDAGVEPEPDTGLIDLDLQDSTSSRHWRSK